MFKHTLKKRMALTGAPVMVLLSMTAPAAMAAPISNGFHLPGDACWPIYYPGCELKLY